ncbi:MAG: hypothetical protein O7E55_08750 [Chloroflexi bacterium]|nr:hypothetical protein [Chloroflexota bacterium]
MIIAIVVLIWGASVVADSAQFPTQLSEEAYRGATLTFRTGSGFLISIVPIWIAPVLADSVG